MTRFHTERAAVELIRKAAAEAAHHLFDAKGDGAADQKAIEDALEQLSTIEGLAGMLQWGIDQEERLKPREVP